MFEEQFGDVAYYDVGLQDKNVVILRGLYSLGARSLWRSEGAADAFHPLVFVFPFRSTICHDDYFMW